MEAQRLSIDVISNNLANVNTNSFKKSRATFQDLMYQTISQAGAQTNSGGEVPTGIQVGMGTMPAGVNKYFSQGDFKSTENELDWAIEGKGFFKVLNNDAEVYTRDGNFKLDTDGAVVTSTGDKLQPEMTVPSDTVSIHVDSSGNVTAFDPEGVGTSIGTLEIYTFPNPAGLFSMGHNLYRSTDASGEEIAGTPGEDGLGTIAQGILEMSNVNVVEEMVLMISAQRAYEINSKAIQTADSMMQIANNIKR
jgi:flagellar basal-body rod protein FlgG